MLEQILDYLSSMSPFWIYITLFLFSFIENVFPPSPSDLVVIFGAALISGSAGDLSFAGVLMITSIGSSLGFMLMYYVGKLFGEKLIRHKNFKFITPEAIDKTDKWFSKYGFKLILANRFLPGTRSVVSFFSGFSELQPLKTFIFASISAFAWNVIIVYMGSALGNNIDAIDRYLSIYGNIGLALTVIVIAGFTVRYFIQKRKAKQN